MKEVLQTKCFKHIFISACVVCASVIHARASFHVDTTAQGRQLTEVEESEAEYPQEQQQEPEPESYEVADQDQDFTNSDNQQGKHRCILTQCHTSVKSLFILYVH